LQVLLTSAKVNVQQRRVTDIKQSDHQSGSIRRYLGGMHVTIKTTPRSKKNAFIHHRGAIAPRSWITPSLTAKINFFVLFAAAASRLASAQGANSDIRPGDSLQEIVVTAEKRNSTVQDTPISLTAITGEQLQAQGISDMKGVIAEVPGISMRSSGPGQTELEMRGLASSGGSSPTVGFYLGDTPLTAPPFTPTGKVVIDPDLFDLNRVEVLRGPQGTLYGSGSMGGTIRLISNEPDLHKIEGNIDTLVSGTQGGGVNPAFNAMFNIPLIDNVLALRVVFTEKYVSGWINRDVVGNFPYPVKPCPGWGTGCTRGNVLAHPITQSFSDVNWENLTGGRAALLFQPNDALSVDLTGLYQKIRTGGPSYYDQSPGASYETHYQPANIAEPFSDSVGLVSLSVNYDLSFAKLTSASSYWRRTAEIAQDSTEGVEGLIATVFGVQEYVPNVFTENDTTYQLSQELRLASSGSSRFQWLVGGFYSNLKQIYNTYNAAPGFASLSLGGAAANPHGILFQSEDPYFIKQVAGFGEVSYAISDAWKATVGLRHYDFRVNAGENQSGVFSTGNAQAVVAEYGTSFAGSVPKFNLEYQPNKNLTLYATASKGFRPGAANAPIPANIGCALTNASYSPDSIWNYEMGEKAQLLDRRLTINSDFFYIKWSGVQQQITQACGYGVNANAGDARSYGPELEITAHLTDEWALSAAGTYTSSEITHVNPAISAADPALVAGFPILNIPKYTANAALMYVHPINADYDFTARLMDSYVGSSTDVAFSYQELPAYNIVNLRLGTVSNGLAGYFFVDNLTNKRADLSVNTTSLSWVSPSTTRVSTNQPRTIGIEARYKF
jgi:iron complex outermembrane receptor protein